MDISQGGTGATTASAARTAIGAAASGANSDITSLSGITDAFGNTNVGAGTLVSNMSTANTAVGSGALFSNTSGGLNTAVGRWTLFNNTTGSGNSGFGASALQSNLTGANNTGLGNAALVQNTSGSGNVAVGVNAAGSNSSGNDNTAIGTAAFSSSVGGSFNTAVGASALETSSGASKNTAVGWKALSSNTAGTENVAVGYIALSSNDVGIYNAAVGGVDGLDYASDIGVTWDGRFIYVTGDEDDGVAIFRQSCGDGTIDPDEVCDDGNTAAGDCCSPVCELEFDTCSTILGKTLLIKDPRPDDATKRSVLIQGIERVSPDVGDPVANGATLEIDANGDGGTREIYSLPAGAHWRATGSVGFKYIDPVGIHGPVKLLLIKKTPGGTFVLKTKLSGRAAPLEIVPPNLGSDGGLKLTIPGGRTYCVRLGGSAGGHTSSNTNKATMFKLTSTGTSPVSEAGCP